MRFIRLITVVFMMVFALPAYAVDFVAEIGAHTGGDTMVKSNTADGSIENLRAGEGFSVAAGFGFAMGKSTDLLLTFGMKQEVIYPANGRISFVRYPIDLLFMFKSDKWAYGFGVTAHMNPLYKEETETSKQTVDFDNATGYLLDVRYVVFEDVFVSGRYTSIEYEVEDDLSNTTVQGNSIGILVGIKL
ncbi:MAG: hypothetical protein OEY52_07620 [Gammaproteobacteria bacterium]|nr:hypothetical protein [Gammaproteobacteria bacterium]